jgi:hypothetical protein
VFHFHISKHFRFKISCLGVSGAQISSRKNYKGLRTSHLFYFVFFTLGCVLFSLNKKELKILRRMPILRSTQFVQCISLYTMSHPYGYHTQTLYDSGYQSVGREPNGERVERNLDQFDFLNFDSETVFELPLFCITKLTTRYSIRFLFLAEP